MNLPKKTIFVVLLIAVIAIMTMAAIVHLYEQDPQHAMVMASILLITTTISLVRDHFKNKNASKPER